MTAMWTKVCVGIFAMCIVALLLANRANAPQVEITTLEIQGTPEITHQRGGTLSTDGESRVLLQIGSALVELSENTDVRLDRLFENDIQLFVTRGRVVVSDAPITLTTDRVSATGSDFELVNYDFQERVTVEPTKGRVTVVVSDTQAESVDADADERLEISELEPFTITRMSSGTSE